MRTTKVFRKRLAFLLDESSLRRLDATIKGYGDPEYSVATRNGLETACPNVDCVLALSNSETAAITRVEARAYGQLETPRTFSFTLSVTLGWQYDNVDYRLEGDAERVLRLSEWLDEWITEIREWYSPIATWELILAGFGFVALCLGLFLVGFLWFEASTGATTITIPGGVAAGGLLTMLTPLAFGILLTLIRRWVFPLATFAFGSYGEKRHRRVARVREVILVSVCLALIVGTALRLIAARFG